MVGSIPIFGWKVEKCTEYEQATTNANFVVAAAKKLEARAEITHTKLIEIDQDAGLYSARVKQLCDFFIHNRITYSEYQDGVGKANTDYTNLRKLVMGYQHKP